MKQEYKYKYWPTKKPRLYYFIDTSQIDFSKPADKQRINFLYFKVGISGTSKGDKLAEGNSYVWRLADLMDGHIYNLTIGGIWKALDEDDISVIKKTESEIKTSLRDWDIPNNSHICRRSGEWFKFRPGMLKSITSYIYDTAEDAGLIYEEPIIRTYDDLERIKEIN